MRAFNKVNIRGVETPHPYGLIIGACAYLCRQETFLQMFNNEHLPLAVWSNSMEFS
jgi:hypothetical protein